METKEIKIIKSHPKKYNAYRLLHSELVKGTIKQEPCIVCGDIKSEAHHDDYDRPLDVVWLCKICHKARHREINGGKSPSTKNTILPNQVYIETIIINNQFKKALDCLPVNMVKAVEAEIIDQMGWAPTTLRSKKDGTRKLKKPERIVAKMIFEGYGIEF